MSKFARAFAAYEAASLRRIAPRLADEIINEAITAHRLEGIGYDPTWLERRREQRARGEIP